jgi:hypothetical protein
MQYYVYVYIRESDGTPYYIGKGMGKRAYQKHTGMRVPNDKSRIILLEKNLTELGAFALERRLIRWWGRKDLGTGILYNMTDGGDGASGIIRSSETRQKIREARKGKPHSEQQKQKMREAKFGKKRKPFTEETKLKMKQSQQLRRMANR